MDWMLSGSPSQNLRCVQQQFNTEERLCYNGVHHWCTPLVYNGRSRGTGELHEQVAQTPLTVYLPVASQGVSYDPFTKAEQTQAWLMDESVCCHQTADGYRLKPHSGGILKHSEDESSSLAEHLSVTCQNSEVVHIIRA